MDLVTLDFETFWSVEHTLKKMSPIEYVMHPLTELQSVSVQVNREKPLCVFGEDEIRRLLDDVDVSNKAVVGHNMSVFDSMILAWRLKLRPLMYLCTLAMARPVYGKVCGLSLEALAKHLGLGVKDKSALINTRGKHLTDFTPEEIEAMRVYNTEDTVLCRKLFAHLRQFFTPDELWHVDCNIRMLVEAELELDMGLLSVALSVERSNKHRALLELAKHTEHIKGEGWHNEQLIAEKMRSEMHSAAKFSALLQKLGVEVPMKRSPKDPKKLIPAIAKTDEAMAELLEHDDEVVAAAARARLSAKSTQLETRIQSFQSTYKVLGKLPVPAHYCGADTTGRDSGFLYNMYNLPRVNPKKPKTSDALRNAVMAPEGKVIGVADSSGIELRVNHTLWQVKRSMDLWSANPKADLYIGTAAAYYGVPDSEISKDDPRRQLGKVLELSCGFGIAGPKLRNQARAQYGLRLTPEEADGGVRAWRARYPEISDYESGGWGMCDKALAWMAAGEERPIDPWGLCVTTKDAIVLPSGRLIRYPNLRQEWTTAYKEVNGELVERKKLSWVYAEGRHKAYLYGGKVDENIVQALARDIIFPVAIEFWKDTGLRPKHKVYDELAYLFEPSVAEEMLAHLQSLLRRSPKWWPQIVLWSEGDVGTRYGEVK